MPATDRLVIAVEENTAEFLLALGRAGGGEERDERGAGRRLHWVIGGSPIAYHNAVFRAELDDRSADRAIAMSIERMRARRVAGSWHVGPSMRPHDLCTRLEAHGFEACGTAEEPGMAASLRSLPAPPALDGFAVERVTGAAQLEAFRSVLASGFGEGEPEANWVCRVYARIGLGDDTDWRHYLGRLDGQPAATTSLYFAAGVAGIYFVCTAPELRRRGLGSAITLHAMHAARSAGHDAAVLTASAMGRGVYEGLGFEQICTIFVPEFDPASS